MKAIKPEKFTNENPVVLNVSILVHPKILEGYNDAKADFSNGLNFENHCLTLKDLESNGKHDLYNLGYLLFAKTMFKG